MDLNIFVKNVYIILLSPAYKYITFYGRFHNSHEIITNWLIHVDNFVQRQSSLLNISLYIFIKRLGRGGRGAFAMFLGDLTPLKFGKL